MDWKNALALLSFSVPLLLISASIAISPYFNIFDNALSDLGHATRSAAAPMFNFGLATGGFLTTYISARYVVERRPAEGTALAISGFLLALVAVFDEVYGPLHFVASLAFFMGLGVFLILYSAHRGKWPLVALCIGLVVWASHFCLRIPKGAAIPELISIFLFLPFYLDLLLKRASH